MTLEAGSIDNRAVVHTHGGDQLPRPQIEPPLGIAESTGKTVHVFGHTHVDPSWLWVKSKGYETFRNSSRTFVKLARNNPEFTFALSSAGLFHNLEQTDPDIFEEMVDLVDKGRLEPVGGMWVEPDEYMHNGPGFVRQLLYGQEYFAKKLGRTARTAWSPDSWSGRSKNMPDILADAGLEFLVYKRPERHQSDLPDLYDWVGENGAKIMVRHLHEYVAGHRTLPTHLIRVARDLRPPFYDGLFPYGIGNHGGGPTQRSINTLKQFRDDPRWPAIEFTLPERFFDTISQQDLPLKIVSGNIDSPAQGHYASDSGIKAGIRGAENDLYLAEVAASLRYNTDVKLHSEEEKKYYPSVDLQRNWRRILFNHFHDISAGTSIPEAHTKAKRELSATSDDAQDITMIALHGIASKIDIPVEEGKELDTYPIVVFNLNGHEVEQFITENVRDPDAHFVGKDLTKTHILVDNKGTVIPMQCTMAEASPFPRMGAVVKVQPGYETFRIIPKPEGYTEEHQESMLSTERTLENQKFRLEVDEETGGIRVYDKEHERDIFSNTAALPIVLRDLGDAWGPERYDQPIPNASYTPISFEKTHEGPLMSALKVNYALDMDGVRTNTTMSQEFRMYRDLDKIEVAVESFLTEPEIAVKLGFPVNIRTYPELTYEIPYSTTTRPISLKEVPGGSWVDITGEHERMDTRERSWHGVTIANTAKYSYSSSYHHPTNETTLYMMMTRSGTYTCKPISDEEKKRQRYLDVGEPQEFMYSITPHTEGWRDMTTHNKAAELNRPLVIVAESAHSGVLPAQETFFSTDQANISLGELKRAENGKGFILRLAEVFEQEARDVHITCLGRNFMLDFKPHELVSVFIPLNDSEPIMTTNLLEIPNTA